MVRRRRRTPRRKPQNERYEFSRDQSHVHATWRGTVTSGTGRYAHARGTISGAGPVTGGHAAYRLTLRLR